MPTFYYYKKHLLFSLIYYKILIRKTFIIFRGGFMKKTNNSLFLLFLVLSLILSGCFFTSFNSSSNSSNEQIENITSFDFVLDDKLIYLAEDDSHILTLYENESYQIKTTIDDILGDNYYLKYTTNSDNTDFTLSENGYIVASSSINENSAITVYVELYKEGSSKRIERKYIIVSLRIGEYANITLNNDNLVYDSPTSTYTMTMDSGSKYNILYSVSYNTAYTISFSLKDSSYLSFMNVDSSGLITTIQTKENKVGEIIIKTIGSNGTLDEIYLKIYLNKAEFIEDELKVYNKSNASELFDGDVISLYEQEELSFDVKFNNEEKTNVISINNLIVLAVDNSTNTIKAINEGTSTVTFKCEEIQITITINVIKDTLLSILADNKGGDFIIINNELHYLNKMFALYESGKKKEITDNSLINIKISDKDENYKTVLFEYENVSITYDVKYYEVKEYEGKTTAYTNNDLYNNHLYGKASILPNSGNVKILVIPVWFNDSNKFFKESQKDQIIEDIKYTMTGNRPNTELSSVKQYYETQSYGAITMDITVSEFYSSSTSYKDYTDSESNYKANNDNILATDAIKWYFENNTNDKFAEYDLNNDGFLDGLILLYGSNYYGTDSVGNASYAFESTNYGNEKYLYNTFAFCPIGGLYGLAKKEPTTQLLSSDLSESYARDFRSSARTIIHEMGHMFGNKDLYEKASNDKYTPAGGFVMQDNNVGGHDPHHTNTIGWSEPEIYASSDYELGDKITVHLSDFQSTGQNIILTNKWNSSNSLFDEYLIIELLAPTKLNEFDSKAIYMNSIESGIRLWHANSLLVDYYNGGTYTSKIISGQTYELASSNYDYENKYDILHLIRNNPNEQYNTTSGVNMDNVLFKEGDAFDMETFKSQFINENKLDNGDKLGWEFAVERIYMKDDGTYGAIITLERVDNVQTEFSKTVVLNRSDLKTPENEEDYSNALFGENGEFTFVYKYVTPPSYYNQEYPISSEGMCLFASSDGNGGYIDLSINPIDGKEVCINSISITYSVLTNASLTVIVDGNKIEGQQFDPAYDKSYGYTFDVNSTSVRIQNQYSETINHWSVLPLLEITIDYTIK